MIGFGMVNNVMFLPVLKFPLGSWELIQVILRVSKNILLFIYLFI